MRKLAWFSAGFAAACLWANYLGAGALPVLAAAALLLLSLALWRFARPRTGENPLLLRRPKDKSPLSRYTRYQLSRRSIALCLGALISSCKTRFSLDMP